MSNQRLQWNTDTSKSDLRAEGTGKGVTAKASATWNFNNTLRTNWNTAITKFGPGTDEYNGLQDDEQTWFSSLLKVLSKKDGKTRLLNPNMGMGTGGWGKAARFLATIPTLGTSEFINEPNEYVGIQYGCLLETIYKACEEHQQEGGKAFANNVEMLGSGRDYHIDDIDVTDLGGKIRYKTNKTGGRAETVASKPTVPRTLETKNKLFNKYPDLLINAPTSLSNGNSSV
tara:strand:+ start:282 stop:968 length:687 start_codon:yes stop_codon:yes gene_type:complete